MAVGEVLVSSPLHVTGFWASRITDNPLTTGSIGAGLVLKPRLLARVVAEPSTTTWRLSINGRPLRAPTVLRVLEAVRRRGVRGGRIEFSSPAPLGVGYAVSAALALTAAVGALLAYNIPTTIEGAARIAHVAEVRELTGLGDVIAMTYGGPLEVRVRPGAPSVGMVERVPVPKGTAVVCVDVMTMDTRSMLSKYGELCDRLAPSMLKELLDEPTLERFLELSEGFSRAVGFLRGGLAAKVERIRAHVLGLYVKKGVLLTVPERDRLPDVVEYLKDTFKVEPKVFACEELGVRVEEVSLGVQDTPKPP